MAMVSPIQNTSGSKESAHRQWYHQYCLPFSHHRPGKLGDDNTWSDRLFLVEHPDDCHYLVHFNRRKEHRQVSMNRVYSILGFGLLFLNGIGAVYGGTMLIVDPSGARIGLSLAWLDQSPFESYLIP